LYVLFSSPATVAMIVAVFLDNTYRVEASKIDQGMPWWAKFCTFKDDVRSEEFCSLPFSLHKFFPPT
jgi:nucleobase transporter 1/2